MLDFGFFPTGKGATDVQQFDRPCTVTNLQMETWRKPRGKAMTFIFCLGGGGGAGGGFTRAASVAGGGGGSGAGSGHTSVLIPTIFLPDILYVQAGKGGGGGVAGANGGAGVASFVCVAPDNSAVNNVVAYSGAAAAFGTTGASGSPGSGGAAPAIPAITSMPVAGLGFASFFQGQGGVSGGAVAGAVGTDQTFPATGLAATGGAGGAGTTSADFAGGGFTAIAKAWISEQRPASPGAGSFDGSGGSTISKPFFSYGGCGGSSSNAGVGGNGGNGGRGCGGGGGGAGTTGGKGGDGGHGLVVVISW